MSYKIYKCLSIQLSFSPCLYPLLFLFVISGTEEAFGSGNHWSRGTRTEPPRGG